MDREGCVVSLAGKPSVEPERVDEMAPRGRPVALGQPHVAELGPGADPGGLDLRRPFQGPGRAFQIALPGQDDAEELVTRRQIRRAGEHRARQRARPLRVALPDERERPAQIRLVGVDLLDAADRLGGNRRGRRQDQPRGEQGGGQGGQTGDGIGAAIVYPGRASVYLTTYLISLTIVLSCQDGFLGFYLLPNHPALLPSLPHLSLGVVYMSALLFGLHFLYLPV